MADTTHSTRPCIDCEGEMLWTEPTLYDRDGDPLAHDYPTNADWIEATPIDDVRETVGDGIGAFSSARVGWECYDCGAHIPADQADSRPGDDA